MRFNIKKVLIIAGVIFAAGAILFTIGLAMADFDITRISTEGEPVTNVYTAGGNIKNINVKDNNNSIVVMRGSSENIKVTYIQNDYCKYNINETDDGTLVIDDNTTSKFRWFSINSAVRKLCIEVPESFDGELKVNTSDGRINISQVKASDILLSTSDGRITISEVNCSNIKAKTSDGSIVVDQLDALKSIALSTSDGSIKGTLCGNVNDYSISSKTSDGSNNLPETSGGSKLLKVQTSDGSIKIYFEK